MYEPQELKNIMYEQQEKFGCYQETKQEKYRTKRLMRLAKFTEVTHFVIAALKKWGLPFTLCEIIHSNKQRQRITTDIFIPNANIVIRQCDSDSDIDKSKQQSYFMAMKAQFYPFFIRPNETKEFVMMKLTNTLMKANENPKNGFKKVKFIEPKKPKEAVKKKRPRIKAVKVEREQKIIINKR